MTEKEFADQMEHTAWLNSLERDDVMRSGMTCASCKWRGPDGFHDSAPELRGPTCRRHAPVATGGMMSGSRTMWPVVGLDDWCGDFDLAELKS